MVKIIILLLFIFQGYGQIQQEWAKRFIVPGDGKDIAISVKADNSGNIYVAGTSRDSGAIGYSIVIVKYSSTGILLWSSRYSNAEKPSAIIIDNHSNIIITGKTQGNGNTENYITLKYSTSGVLLWDRIYDGTAGSGDESFSLAADKAGSIYVTGRSKGLNTGYDCVTIKYSSAGSEEWVQRYNGSGNFYDEGKNIDLDESGNLYVTGKTVSSGINYDFLTIKYSPEGKLLWVQTYNSSGNNPDESLFIHAGITGIYIAGISYENFTGYDRTLIKYNNQGNLQWIKKYNSSGGNYDFITDFTYDNSECLLITGNEGNTFSTVKYDNAGNQIWVHSHNVRPAAILTDSANNVYLTGTGEENGYYILKYNPAGIMQWQKHYKLNSKESHISTDLDIDYNGNLIVTGYISNMVETNDFLTVKFSQITGIYTQQEEYPKKFLLFQNYPNPFNPVTKIKFDIPNDVNVKITVYDLLGREVQVLANEFKKAGSYEINFDGTVLSSGSYFYKLEAGDYKAIKKMILLK